MRQGVIIVCRMNSSRLPGKTLAPVGDRPLLWYVCSRLEQLRSRGIEVLIATSDAWYDEPIASFCLDHGLTCFRGDSQDVAGRLLSAARAHRLDAFARVNGDSPFVEASLLEQGFERMQSESVEFVTNLVPRTYPYGVAVEVLRTEWFARLVEAMTDPMDREHVTRAIYRDLHCHRVGKLQRAGVDLSGCRMTVDTPDDLEWFRQFIAGYQGDWTNLGYEHAAERVQPQRRAG